MRKSYRFLCLLLCLMLTCSTALAAEFSLPEKMNRQVTSGSGVKGAVTIAVAGGAEWLDLLLPFTGSDLQIRYIVNGDRFQAQLYALDDQEQQRALTQAYGDGEHLYLRSDLLPDAVLSLPLGGNLMDALFGGDAENPTFYSVIDKLLGIRSEIWERDWAPALAPYETALEQWLMEFAADPSVTQSESGSSIMTLRYTIPASALKRAMKDMMRQALQDATLLELLRPLLTDAQQAVYLNPAIGYFYDAVIDALPLNGDLTMTRTLSTRGEMLSSLLTMPLPENPNGWSTLSCQITERETSLILTGAEQSVTLALLETASMSDRTSWDGFLRFIPVSGTPLSAAFTLSKQFAAQTDDNGRRSEHTEWVLTARPDLSHLEAEDPARADYADFDDITVSFSTHYASGAQDNNPTTLDILLSARLPSVTLDMAMTLRSTSPWVLSDLPTGGAEPILTLTPDRIATLLGEFSRNAALTMTTLTSVPTAEPEPIEAEPTLVPPAAQ